MNPMNTTGGMNQINPMNKTTSVMHFFKADKKDTDKMKETGGFDTDPKSRTYQKDNRSSSQKDVARLVREQTHSDFKMPNIHSQKDGLVNLADNKLFESSQKIFRNKFGIVPDVEKIKDELMKFKQEFNKKSKELSILKKDYFKLQVRNITKSNFFIFQLG